MSIIDDPAIATGIDPVDAAFAVVVEHLRAGDPDAGLPRVHGFQRRLDAVEAELLAARRRAGASDAQQHSAAGQGQGRTKRDAQRRADRADTLIENPALGEALDGGTLTPDQLDAIATASKQSDGDAARDDQLIDRVKAANPDQAQGIARDWLNERRRDDELEAEQERTRRLRTVRRFTTERGTSAMFAEGDREAIDRIWKRVNDLATTFYESDGGRDRPGAEHPRTRDQRRFDALHHLATSASDSGESPTVPRPARPTIVITDRALASGEIIGSGPIPASSLARLACDAEIVGVVFGQQGQPLWAGRSVRTVSKAHWLALVARDRGCVLCGADPQCCEAHHIIPWHAPARGRTDVDNLALLCTNCHHHVHAGHHTLVPPHDHHTGTWTLRPATAAETPPPRPKSPP